MNLLDVWSFSLMCDFNENHDPASGRFTSGAGGSKIKASEKLKTKYAPSKQQNFGRVQLNPDEYGRVCGAMMTNYPSIQSGMSVIVRSGNFMYDVTAAQNGGLECNLKWRVKRGKRK